MSWYARYSSDPRFGSVVRLATGRPAWVLKGTVAVGVVVFALPLIALAVLMLGALAVTVLAWTVLSAVSRVIDSLTGQGQGATTIQMPDPITPPPDDGRENVRVVDRS